MKSRLYRIRNGSIFRGFDRFFEPAVGLFELAATEVEAAKVIEYLGVGFVEFKSLFQVSFDLFAISVTFPETQG